MDNDGPTIPCPGAAAKLQRTLRQAVQLAKPPSKNEFHFLAGWRWACAASNKKPPKRRLFALHSCLRLCEAERRSAFASIGHETNTQETEEHHRPG